MSSPTEEPIAEAKAGLRRQVLRELKTLSTEQISELSCQACSRLAGQPLWSAAKRVLGFAPMAGELDIWPVLLQGMAEGKMVALPRFHRELGCYRAYKLGSAADVQAGYFGIREPGSHCEEIDLMRLDLVLVPGIAFDSRGRRLGRGKGYYDRVLPAARGAFCGVAFDQQVVSEVPVAPHDASVGCILTPTRWIVAVESAPVLE